MIEAELNIITPDGSMNTFITYPEEGGPYPVILFLMDAPGKREELHDMARRIGTAGSHLCRAINFVGASIQRSRSRTYEWWSQIRSIQDSTSFTSQ